jgi:hypothetical protein
MNKNKSLLITFVLGLGLVLALSGGILMAARAQGPGPRGGLSPQAAVGTAFTYQGRLMQGSTPVSGICDFQFYLYDDSFLFPTQIGGPVEQGNVQVTDGYFSVSIDFGADAFTGEGRQLQILVRCPAGSGSYTTLSPMVMLSPAPYALSLRPGALVNGSVGLGSVLRVENTYGGMLSSYGITGASQDTGVLGTGGNFGVYGQSSEGYGIYSNGDAHVEGNLTWITRTSYIAVSAAAFSPRTATTSYTNSGFYLGTSAGGQFYAPVQLPHGATLEGITFHWWDDSPGNTITCTLYVDGMGSGPMNNKLVEIPSTGLYGPGFGSAAITGEYAVVDNSQNIYYLEWDFDGGGGVQGDGVVIRYYFTEPY